MFKSGPVAVSGLTVSKRASQRQLRLNVESVRQVEQPGSRTRLHPRRWVWELVTPDGHVAHQSPPFSNREACEANAKEQDLPVEGLSRKRPN